MPRKYRINADTHAFTIQKQINHKNKPSTWASQQYFSTIKELAFGLREMGSKYLVSQGEDALTALKASTQLILELLESQTVEFSYDDLEKWAEKIKNGE